MSTHFHSRLLALELTKRLPAETSEKLSQSLANATVDLNPHQVDAALFAFRSPLSRGAILADEVGLGKTIEAGLIVAQLWAERKRRIIIIVPASLRKQWNQELLKKFHLESTILEAKSYNQAKKAGQANPFDRAEGIFIVSYQFVSSKLADVKGVPWNLAIVDEAHRLRNVYKTGNKTARQIRSAVGDRPKLLLTATPLQNSLLELYGLVSFIDNKIFGSEASFRDQFCRRAEDDADFDSLKNRLAGVCHRTLRRQVTQYVKYPRRLALTQDFTPTESEHSLYVKVSEYLQKPDLHALPNSQRQLITLVLRKILASSSFALAATLETMIARLEGRIAADAEFKAAESITDIVGQDIADTAEVLDEEAEEYDEPTDAAEGSAPKLTIAQELEELKSYQRLAESIQFNAKGEALKTALAKGFEKAAELGAPQKALIFTESRRTQEYLAKLLTVEGYTGQIVLFNGTNDDPSSKAIFKKWKTANAALGMVTGSPSADMRAALVDEFRDNAKIMIATEAAAEGVNLQFCNLVVNYDLPWNPQRIEQRIGRCHRYGQEFDVVVINFLNRKNQADVRVFELLNQKLMLFDGVFGASDEIMGALESGIDFERRIGQIHQSCRTTEEIDQAFDELQSELEVQITAAMTDARNKIFQNFDGDVHKRLRNVEAEIKVQRNQFDSWLYELTRIELAGEAVFDADGQSFRIEQPLTGMTVNVGQYRLPTNRKGEADTGFTYRIGHPLAVALVDRALTRPLECRELQFDYEKFGGKIGVIEPLIGHSGWLRLVILELSAFEVEDRLVMMAITDDGTLHDSDMTRKLFSLPATDAGPIQPRETLDDDFRAFVEAAQGEATAAANARNARYLDDETAKLDHWAEDQMKSLERELKVKTAAIEDAKKAARLAQGLAEKLEHKKKVAELDREYNHRKRTLYDDQDRIAAEKDTLLDEVAVKLTQTVTVTEVFTVRWHLD